ncbi:hypothetical protein BH09PSE2_BH09PSE2_25250 [soil metagenome]
MDIHKPKPVHSWREFVSEIAVVVVGISIALTGEQIIERLHEHRVADEAREQIRAEAATDLAVLGNRVKVEPCLDKRFAELRQMLAKAGTPEYPAPNWIGRPGAWDNQSGRWQAASQGGRIALLSSVEQGGFSFIYGQLAQILLVEADERQQWSHLEALQGVSHPSSSLIDAARPALSQAMADDQAIRIRIAESTTALHNLGVASVRSPVESKFESVCIPTSTPTADGYERRDRAVREAS